MQRLILQDLRQDLDGIAQTQTPVGATPQTLVLNGAFVTGGIAFLPQAQKVVINSTGNDSARRFTVYGAVYINNDSNQKKYLYESFAGANAGQAFSANNYNEVYEIRVDAGTAGAVSAGIDFRANSRMIIANRAWTPMNSSISVEIVGDIVIGFDSYLYETIVSHTAAAINQPGFGANWQFFWRRLSYKAPIYLTTRIWVSGTAYAVGSLTYTVQQTFDDIRVAYLKDDSLEGGFKWFNSDDSAVVAATTTKRSNFMFPVTATRVVVGPYVSGGVFFTVGDLQ